MVTSGLAHRSHTRAWADGGFPESRAAGADSQGDSYWVHLILEGVPYRKPKHPVGSDTIGLDLGPSSIALGAREGEASLAIFSEERKPDVKARRCLQRTMERQRRAANPEHCDAQGR